MEEKLDHKISEALKAEPKFEFSPDFGQNIMRKISRQEKIQVIRSLLLQAVAIVAFVGAVLSGLTYVMGIKMLLQLFPYIGWTVGFGGLLFAIQYLDAYLIQRKWLSRTERE